MILSGPTKSVLFKLSMPLIFSNVIATLYNLADGVWLAQLSYTKFAATSFTWPLVFLFISIAIGISVAGTSIISQMIGADDRDRATKYANNLIIISIIIGIIFSVIGFFSAEKIMKILGAKGELAKYSAEYFKVYSLGFLADTLYFAFQAILNAQGKTKSTTLMGFLSGILNIVLDPIFIFATIPWTNIPGLNLGVSGAAIATIISKIVAVVIGLIATKRDTSDLELNLDTFKPDISYIKRLFKLAIPTAIGRSSAALGFTVMNAIIVGYGQELVAGFSMVNRVSDFWMQISLGISSAMTAMIGQNIGAKQFTRAKEIVKDARFMIIASSIVGIVLFITIPDQLIRIFIDPNKAKEVYDIAMEYIPYAAATMIFMGLFNLYQGIFQGTGFMKYSMHMSTGRLWIIRVPLVLFLQHFTNIGQTGIWLGMLISNMLIILYSALIYRKKNIIPDEVVVNA